MTRLSDNEAEARSATWAAAVEAPAPVVTSAGELYGIPGGVQRRHHLGHSHDWVGFEPAANLTGAHEVPAAAAARSRSVSEPNGDPINAGRR
ncbi:MAG: hypothetical protein L0H96_17460 [Humibacillus sp.]|nr:hypothetical protein [Humibacillus sp.]MDN5778685.1 hypothetical protein [Humibacillus sp.]